ncbi:ribonuclease J [uncultured Flavonifractor sp.]|mgnify:FL=1|uniref:ribonuclease J n=1 Tax=uncultured Flavonifractor sp. TaxID=1193534 RepID=UPI00260DB64B|nr:ribonuclease J [uncultured Flavonifractor sp.]
MNKNIETLFFALGGLGEVGKNMYVIEHDDEIIIIDAGVMFPKDELLGIDYVLADHTYLINNKNKIKALFITHGHEDHIGGIPFLLNEVEIPVIYASNVATELIKHKLDDKNIKYNNIKIINENVVAKFNHFEVEFFRTTHSIPDSYGIAIHTPNGTIVTTGDFKFDLTPIGPMANLQKMASLGEKGVRLLLSDSTNALVPGFSISESAVDEALGELFARSTGRIILATFASNIYRVAHIIETCKDNNRKIVVFGRSMINSIEIAKSCGFISDDNIFITSDEANRMNPSEVCILCTGSQGEPLAALSRIANGVDSNVKLLPDDTIIFSSSPIPGNALSINRVINKLYLKGAKVYTNASESDIHTSGHGKQDELKLIMRLIKPEYFIPIHGEYRMLKKHAEIANSCSIDKDHTFVIKNGDRIALNKDKVYLKDSIPINSIYVDGKRIGNIGTSIIKDRKIMSTDGVLIAILNVNSENRTLTLNPNVTTRGFVIVNENQNLINDIEKKIKQIAISELNKETFNHIDLKNRIILEINSYIIELTGRRPIIMPMILETKI